VLVSNATGSVTSNAAILTVSAAPVAPAITTQPASRPLRQPDRFLQRGCYRHCSLSYQWRKNGWPSVARLYPVTPQRPLQVQTNGAQFIAVSATPRQCHQQCRYPPRSTRLRWHHVTTHQAANGYSRQTASSRGAMGTAPLTISGIRTVWLSPEPLPLATPPATTSSDKRSAGLR